ncbi:MAG: MCE family protein [Ferruginibacter sp.]|nr:MCE family protein [Ferruginibacter sp.]
MGNKSTNNLKLGIFVIAGLLVLVAFLYFIGKKRNMFGSTFLLKVQFHNVQGLMPGNNVRYAGIQAGTVGDIFVQGDTIIEVEMNIVSSLKNVIKSNAVVSIGTDGIVGNKVLNIIPAKISGSAASPGTFLIGQESFNTEDLMNMLGGANDDLSFIMKDLRTTIQRFNNSKGFWELINSETIASDLKESMENLQQASVKINNMSGSLNEIVADLKNGKGSAGRILRDTQLIFQLEQTAQQLNGVGGEAKSVVEKLNGLVDDVDHKINNGNGPISAVLNDKEMTNSIKQSLDNIEKGTRAFEANMEALKHNFLFRGYFKKLEKREKKQ